MRKNRPVIETLRSAILSAVCVSVSCLFPATASAASNPVADWNQVITQSIGRECQTPALASRNLATYHMAIAAAIEKTQDRSEKDQILAAASAAKTIGKMLFSGEEARFDELVPQSGLTAEQVAMVELGEAIAVDAMEIRQGDSTTTTENYSTTFEPGQWQRTSSRPPELPHWNKVRPFLLKDAQAFLPPPPPALNSPEYAKAVREVQTYGAIDSIERTPEQTLIAKFWSDFSYTSTPPGHWNEIARFLAREKKLDLMQSARLFAAMNLAMADVSIVCWNAKYHYNFWRPVTAIHLADKDGNPETHSNPEWKPLLNTPPHPDYTSGHAAFSGAAAEVMKSFFPDGTEFSVSSDTLPDVVRHYNSFEACAKEISESRVFGGIHYRFSGENGLALGRSVGALVLQSIGSKNISHIVHSQQASP